jgi:hypothetical protein
LALRPHSIVLRSPDPLPVSGIPISPSGSRAPVPDPTNTGQPGPAKIQAFEQRIGGIKRGEETWKRTPTATGHGAVHVRTFHCKMSEDAMGYLDQQVNDWLDGHPHYEVKHVVTCVGEWQGKLGKEAHLVVQVWV